jgi:hypothetical protein
MMEAWTDKCSARARLVGEKFPSTQVNFPNPSSCCYGTKVRDRIHQVNCACKKISDHFRDALIGFSVKNFLTDAKK